MAHKRGGKINKYLNSHKNSQNAPEAFGAVAFLDQR